MRRRHKVALRPAARRERNAKRAAAAGVLALGALAAAVAWNFPRGRLVAPAWPRWTPLAGAALVKKALISGAPGPLEKRLVEAVGPTDGLAGFREPLLVARRLKASFPCLESVRVRRDWLGHSVRFEVSLRKPVAAVTRDGSAAGWLSEEGVLFAAPDGTYSADGLPVAELHRWAQTDPAALAQLFEAARKGGALPSPVARVEYRSRDEGWDAVLADGTTIRWGNLSWTDQKLARLREVLADAGGRFAGAMTADLRYFEDGKVLVRPAPARDTGRGASSTGGDTGDAVAAGRRAGAAAAERAAAGAKGIQGAR